MTKLSLDPITCKASIKKLNTVKWKQGNWNNIAHSQVFCPVSTKKHHKKLQKFNSYVCCNQLHMLGLLLGHASNVTAPAIGLVE